MPAFSYSAHLGYLFTEMPLHQRIAAARRHGFEAIEHPSPYGIPATQMSAWLNEAGLVYTQFGLYSGDAARGEKGLGIFPDRREEFRSSVERGLDYAQQVGVRMVHAMAGVLPASVRRQEHWDCYIENLAFAADQAAVRGITILVEAMSKGAVPDYFIETADRGAEAIAQTGKENIKLLLDVFHTLSMSFDIHQQIRKHRARIAHVHIAGYPGRHEPGPEALDLDALERSLAECGYSGWLGCEYKPAGETEAGLAWLHARIAGRPPAGGSRI